MLRARGEADTTVFRYAAADVLTSPSRCLLSGPGIAFVLSTAVRCEQPKARAALAILSAFDVANQYLYFLFRKYVVGDLA